MKDKILKQIEENVKLKLSVIISNEVMSGNEKQEAILQLFGSHNNIKESVNENLLRQVQRLTTWLRMEGNDDDIKMILEAEEVMNEAESIIAASQNTEKQECDTPCGMNYCDENGCTNRKRNLVEPIELPKENTVSNEGEKWVSVDDRLPEAYETIISYNIHTDEVSTDYIDNDKRWDVLNPTHWMPLPQPPKEK